MIDIKLIRDDADDVKRRLADRKVEPEPIDEVLKLDETWRAKKTEGEVQQAALNKANKAFGPWMGGRKKNPDMPAPQQLVELLGETPADPETAKEKLRLLGEEKDKVEAEADAIMKTAPTLLDAVSRNILYKRLHQILHEEQPYSFIYTPVLPGLVSKKFAGIYTSDQFFQWYDIWLNDPSLPEVPPAERHPPNTGAVPWDETRR